MRRLQINKRPLALRDLEDIFRHIAGDSPDAAMRFRERLEQRLDDLARFPRSGRSRDELSPGIRTSPVGNYLIVYTVAETHIDIVRVLHGARNIERLLGDDEDR